MENLGESNWVKVSKNQVENQVECVELLLPSQPPSASLALLFLCESVPLTGITHPDETDRASLALVLC